MIRTGVTFHEGGTLEPHDVAYTTQRALLQGCVDGPQLMLYEGFFGSNLAVASSKDLALAGVTLQLACPEVAHLRGRLA